MNFQFKLRIGKKRATIISELRLGSNIRIRISTPYCIPAQSVKFWDAKRQLIKTPNDILEADCINEKLNVIRLKVYSDFSHLEKQSPINIKELKDKLYLIVKPIHNIMPIPKDSHKNGLVIEYYQWYIDFYMKHMSPNTGKIFSKSTLRTYGNALRFMKDYLKTRGVKDFSFDDISKDFYYDFIEYGEDLGYSKNYLGSMMQKFKTVVRSAYDEEIHQNREFKKGYFKKFREDINHPYLTEDEILKLFKLKIENTYLDNIRDLSGLQVSKEVVKTLSDFNIEYITYKILAYIYDKDTSVSLVYSILELKYENKNVTDFLSDLFANHLVFNYHSVIDFLNEKKKTGNAKLKKIIVKIIKAGEARYVAYSDLKLLKEFEPSERRLTYYNKIQSRKFSKSFKENETKDNSFLSMVKNLHYRTGKSLFTKYYGKYTEKMTPALISHSGEMPRGEFIDPVGQAKERLLWQNFKRRQ